MGKTMSGATTAGGNTTEAVEVVVVSIFFSSASIFLGGGAADSSSAVVSITAETGSSDAGADCMAAEIAGTSASMDEKNASISSSAVSFFFS